MAKNTGKHTGEHNDRKYKAKAGHVSCVSVQDAVSEGVVIIGRKG